MSPSYPLAVYYDKSCPMCREEIHVLKSVDHHERLRLIDCSTSAFTDEHVRAAHIDQRELMSAMHVRDASGQWFTAVDAFVQLYTAVGVDTIARVWAHKRLRPVWDRLYPLIARHRAALSRLGLHVPMRWLIRRLAKRAALASASCPLPPDQG